MRRSQRSEKMTTLLSVGVIQKLVHRTLFVVDIKIHNILEFQKRAEQPLFDVGLRNLLQVIPPTPMPTSMAFLWTALNCS